MISPPDDSTAKILGHLIEMTAGECSITSEEIVACEAGDQRMAEILTALLYLHEDLVYREQLHVEALARMGEQNAALEQSRAALEQLNEELSTPLIRIGRGVLMAPLIGAMDDMRAQAVMERVLQAVVAERARHLILDVTGVRRIDEETIDRFVRIIGAIRLLGARCILAGVQPQVAAAIAQMGVDMRGVQTFANVEAALEYALRARA